MSLKHKTIKGVKWSGAARGGQQILQIIVTVILARLLTPDDFGILAMAVVFTGLIAVFNDFGIGSAIIHKQDLSDDDLSSIFWFSACIGLIATFITIAISPLVALFYNRDILRPLLSLMALGFFFTSISTVHKSMLTKEMNFKKIAVIEIVAAVIGGIVALSLAYRGFGVWSLAWQGLVSSAVMALLFWGSVRWKPRIRFHTNSIKSIMGFTVNLVGFSTINYFSRNIDYLLVGKYLGAESLGYYTLAYRMMLFPLQNISSVIARVLFPAFSSIQQDDDRFRNAYLRSTKFIAFVTFPMMFMLFAVADEFILTLFGPQWEPTIILIKVLCFVGMLQSIGTTVGQIYLAKGKPDWMLQWGIVDVVITIISVSIGLLWGLEGVVIAYAIRTLLLTYPNFAIPFRLIGLQVITLMMYLKTELFTALMMFILVLLSGMLLRSMSLAPAAILSSNVILGTIIYVVSAKYINTDVYNEIYGMLWNKKKA